MYHDTYPKPYVSRYIYHETIYRCTLREGNNNSADFCVCLRELGLSVPLERGIVHADVCVCLGPTLESDWSVPNYRGFSQDLSKWPQLCQKAELRKILTILWVISTENTPTSLDDFNVYDFITKTCYFFYNRKMFKAHIEFKPLTIFRTAWKHFRVAIKVLKFLWLDHLTTWP